MIKLLALLTVFILCTPAYGEILVYKVSGKINGIDLEEQDDIKMKLRGYFLMDMDFTQSEIAGSTLILSGCNGSHIDLQETIDNIVYEFSLIEKTSTYEYLSIEFYDEGYGFDAILSGKTKYARIGSGNKQGVAKTLKGSLICSEAIPILDHNTMGSGSIKLRLSAGKTININRKGMSLRQAVMTIQEALYNSGHEYY
jgi:hypothetical protein